MRALELFQEESPNTLEGSFTPDLVESKLWLSTVLAKGLNGRSAGRIYILGSWFGNLGIFLQEANVIFDDLVLVEKDEKLLDQSQKLLQPLYDEGRVILLNTDAKDVMYEEPATVINCSCNEMTTEWFNNVPKNTLVVMQARNNVANPITVTNTLEEFNQTFLLIKKLFLGKKSLTDPETQYERYMKIGLR